MLLRQLEACYGTLASTESKVDMQEYGECTVPSLPSPDTDELVIHAILNSITTITTFVYLTTFAPVVYWIFLKNYFR